MSGEDVYSNNGAWEKTCNFTKVAILQHIKYKDAGHVEGYFGC